MEDRFNKQKTELPPLKGQKIRILYHDRRTWCPGTDTGICKELLSYEVTTPNGTTVRRNRSQLREILIRQVPAVQPRQVTFEDEAQYIENESTSGQGDHHTSPCEEPPTSSVRDTVSVRRSGRGIRKPAYIEDYVSD